MWPFTSSYPERSAGDVAGKTYDYVIVGGGTAGCVIASRLSEDKDVSVLVLERGKVWDSMITRNPVASQDVQSKTSQSVLRMTVPVKDCGDRPITMCVAEAMGGNSRINSMLYTRGHPSEYNTWRDMGHPDWSYDKVLPYFIKSERREYGPPTSFHGKDGLWPTTRRAPPFKIYQYLKKAAESLGVPVEEDINAPDVPSVGFFDFDWTMDDKNQRSSTYRAFLPKELALRRERHLTVCTGVQTVKLETDEKGSRITKVHFKPAKATKDGQKPFHVNVRKEAIVCCGTICSPQLLLLSGIGPREHLEDVGIEVVRDLPGVGENFADHHAVPIMLKVPPKESFHRLINNPLLAVWHLLLWIFLGTGLMSQGTTFSAIFGKAKFLDNDIKVKALTETEKDGSDPRNIPDFEIMLFPTQGVHKLIPGMSLFTLFTTIINPKSSGSIKLDKNDLFGHPIINYWMLSDPSDIAICRAAVRFAMNMALQIKKSGYPDQCELWWSPAGETKRRPEELSDEEIDTWIRGQIMSAYHYSCSCKMAPLEDMGVVDDELKVHGFKNLRIADASIFPKIPTCHTMAPVVMVAERCADFVKKEGKLKA